MTLRTAFCAALLAAICVCATAALGGELQPGDRLHYRLLNKGEETMDVAVFVSATQLDDADGKVRIRRTASGSRIESWGWLYEPHDGEFPEDGVLRPGAAWEYEIETVKVSGGETFTHVRACSVVQQSDKDAAGMTFPGALLVSCSWHVPGYDPYQSSRLWYWPDGQGYNLQLGGVIDNKKRGKTTVELLQIESPTFAMSP